MRCFSAGFNEGGRDWGGRAGVVRVASNCAYLFPAYGGCFACMSAPENRLCPLPRVDVGQVGTWFEDVKKVAQSDLLVKFVSHGAPVEVGEVGYLDAALRYGKTMA